MINGAPRRSCEWFATTHDADEFEPPHPVDGTHGRASAGFASGAEWAHGWNGCAVFASLSLHASVSLLLSRFLWPSSNCVRENGGSGKTEIRHRERGITCVSGRRRQGCDQCAVERLGSGVSVAQGGRRLEIIADGLPLFGGVQFAVDATLVSLLTATERAVPVPPVWMVQH